MGKCTIGMLCKSTSTLNKRKPDQSAKHYLKRITHLYLNNKQLDEIGEEINACLNLNVLYLYDNNLQIMPNFSQLSRLTHLYLQNNRISHIENLNCLQNLEKLFLSRNQISVIEGLENLTKLNELRVDNQILEPGEILVFDSRSLNALENCLKRLDVSGNKLETLQDLIYLKSLTYLNAQRNELENLDILVQCLNMFPHLKELGLLKNPVLKNLNAKKLVIINCPSLEMLDEKSISGQTRQFLDNWNQFKISQTNELEVKRQLTFEEKMKTSLTAQLDQLKMSTQRHSHCDYLELVKLNGDLKHCSDQSPTGPPDPDTFIDEAVKSRNAPIIEDDKSYSKPSGSRSKSRHDKFCGITLQTITL